MLKSSSLQIVMFDNPNLIDLIHCIELTKKYCHAHTTQFFCNWNFSCEIQHERIWRHPLVEQSELLENDDSAAATHIACSRQMFLSPITFETIKLQLSFALGCKVNLRGEQNLLCFAIQHTNLIITRQRRQQNGHGHSWAITELNYICAHLPLSAY